MTGSDTRTRAVDVAIVGGGPTGCSAGVFAARYGLETAVFDRGRSSLRQCAHLENYLGYPAGIDVDTFYEMMHDHAREAGCELVADLVTGVNHESRGFRVETECGPPVQANRVLAATKYGAAYLEPLDEEVTLLTNGGAGRRSEDGPVNWNGRTAIDGLYVAGPLAGIGDQAIIAAGHGAIVARTLITDVRRRSGYWTEIEEPHDWVRREAELADEWRDRQRWHDWFDSHHEPEALTEATVESLREAYIDEALGMYIDETEREQKASRGQRRIAEHLNDELQLEAISDEQILDYAATISSDSATLEVEHE